MNDVRDSHDRAPELAKKLMRDLGANLNPLSQTRPPATKRAGRSDAA